MSNFLAVATITAVLRLLLQGPADDGVSGAVVTTERPDARANSSTGAGVNVFLYQVRPNAALRNADLATRSASGQLLQRRQAALDLLYLLSFYGDDTELEPQRLLGSVVRTCTLARSSTQSSSKPSRTRPVPGHRFTRICERRQRRTPCQESLTEAAPRSSVNNARRSLKLTRPGHRIRYR